MIHCEHESCGAAEKELERVDFDDAYSTTRSEQKEVFIRAVKKYSKVREDTIRASL